MSRALSPGRMPLVVALVGHHIRNAGLEHRARFAASDDDTGDHMIDIVEIEGGIPVSIRLRGSRFGVVRYHRDGEGEVSAVEACGWYDTPALAAACVVAVLRRAAGAA